MADRLIGSFFIDSTNHKSYSARRKSIPTRPLRLSTPELRFFDEISKVRSMLVIVDAFRLAVEDLLLDQTSRSSISSALGDRCQAYDTVMTGHLESTDWEVIFSADWGSWPIHERPRSVVEMSRPDVALPDDLRQLARNVYDHLVTNYE